MTASFSAGRLPAAIARAAVAPAAALRRLAPEPDAAPEWSRQLFDPAQDEDALEWLGFTAPDAA